jgi:hypothetical protein
MEDRRVAYRFWSGHLRKREHLENLSVDRKVFYKRDGRAWTGFIWFRIETIGGLL